MDLILSVADRLVFDSMWAKLVPFSATTATRGTSFALNETQQSWASLFTTPPPVSLSTLSSHTAMMKPVSAWPREFIPRQLISVSIITMVGICVLYFLFAGLSYYFIFNHDMMKHPKFLKNQVRLEIESSLKAFPVMTLLTLPWFMAEVRGYTRLYDNVGDYGWTYLVLSIPMYVKCLRSS